VVAVDNPVLVLGAGSTWNIKLVTLSGKNVFKSVQKMALSFYYVLVCSNFTVGKKEYGKYFPTIV
jgi:hypothetical protein